MPEIWSIDVWQGPSPYALAPTRREPVLQAADIHDVPDARFVADPFLIRSASGWRMTFEILPADEIGVIGLASSDDGLRWRYEQVVLREPFHLSYPHVFEHEGHHYMTPETLGADCVRLYQADPFPLRWRCVAELVPGQHADPTPFRHGGRWWLLTCSTPWDNHTLRLYMADQLQGPWREHPCSPLLVGQPDHARPGGRVIVDDQGRLVRFAQDCSRRYGEALAAFEIVALDAQTYRERPLGRVLGPGPGWRALGMHQLDAQRLGDGGWLACVDGQRDADR